jgi:signal transduction histidine kinase
MQKVALEKKDEFITIASHELKTAVTSIKGYVQLLQHNFPEEGNIVAADVLNKVDIQINKLTGLITDLLDVKKIENGQFQYHKENFDFNELVREITEETGRVLKKHKVETKISGPKVVYGDRNKIGQLSLTLWRMRESILLQEARSL